MDEAVGKQAGDDGPARDDHGDDAHVGDGYIELEVDDGPARTQEGIGEPQADEREIDECKK